MTERQCIGNMPVGVAFVGVLAILNVVAAIGMAWALLIIIMLTTRRASAFFLQR